ncbi:MAG: hypothetical protein LDL41_07770 [Coleofasciculus sp. S288]|nr:hypothetical protein [Coleofasciculus sp. S288]
MSNIEQQTQLQAEAEAICAFLREHGYRLDSCGLAAWKVTKGSDVYLYILSYLPHTRGDWGLTPQDNSPAYQDLDSLLKQALANYRGGADE